MSKLTLHLQSIPGYVNDFASSGIKWIKIVDPPMDNPFPGVKVIGRMFMPDSDSNALIRRGAAGAEEWFNMWRGEFLARPYVTVWEAPNEPQPMGDAGFRASLDAFTSRLAVLMRGSGLTLAGMCWAVGWPDTGHAPQFAASMNALVNNGHFLALHQYSAPTMQDDSEHLSLRHRLTITELRNAGIPVPPILITECGIDGGVISSDYARKGWQEFTNEEGYLAQLKWFDSEIKKDAEVVAATIFTVCNFDWFSFNVTESLANKLASYIESDEEGDSLVLEVRGIDASQFQYDIDWGAVADAGIKFAMIRATVCRSDGTVAEDPYFKANWAGAKDAGILRGAYHYLHQSASGQSIFFVNAVGEDRPELGYWADIEDGSLTADKCRLFLEATDRNSGETCHVYTRKSFFDKFGAPEWVAGRKLWVASYDVSSPALPSAWSDWEFWQYTSNGTVPGISVAVDLDWYNGSEIEFYDEYGGESPITDLQEVIVRLDAINERLDVIIDLSLADRIISIE